MKTDPIETISVVELTKRWGMSFSTISRGIEEGLLPGRKIGSRHFIPLAHVIQFEQELSFARQPKVPVSEYIRSAAAS